MATEKATVILDVRTDNSQKSLRGMRLELKELQKAMDEAGKAGDEKLFNKLSEQFAKMRNDIMHTSEAMKYLDPGELLGGWVKTTQGMVGGFAAVTGALQLFGSENEKIQEMQKKSMALIQTMIGLEQVRATLIDGGARKQLKALVASTAARIKETYATVAQTIAQKAQTMATEGTTVATRLLGRAMMSVPVLAVAAAIAALVIAVIAFTRATKESTEAQKSYETALQKVNDETKDLRSNLELLEIKILSLAPGTKAHTKAIEEYNKVAKEAGLMTLDLTASEEDLAKAMKDNSKLFATIHAQMVADEAITENSIKLKEKKSELQKEEIKLADAQEGKNIKKIQLAEREIKTLKESIAELEQVNSSWIDFTVTIDKFLDTGLNEYMEEQLKKWEALGPAMKKVVQQIRELSDVQQEYINNEPDEEDDKEKLRRWQAFQSELKNAASWYEKLKYSSSDATFQITSDYKTQLKIAEDFYKRKLISHEQYESAVYIISKEYKEKMDQLNWEAFELELQLEVMKAEAAGRDTEHLEKRLEYTREWIASMKEANAEIMNESFSRVIANASWEEALVLMDKYYGEGIINEEEYNAVVIKYAKMNLEANKMAYDMGLISAEEFQMNLTEITRIGTEERILLIESEMNKYMDMFNQIASNLNQIFSMMTQMMLMEIDAQDAAWKESFDKRNEGLDEHIQYAKDTFGEESERYKDLMAEKIRLDEEKRAHEKKIEAEKKAAEKKFAKAKINIQMVQATADFAKGIFEIWANSLGQGIVGIIQGILLSALLGTVFGTQMSLLSKQKSAIDMYKYGGYIHGPSHEAGGVKTELEGGEGVINKKSMAIPGVRNLASQLNELGGGVSFRDETGQAPLTVDTTSVANAVIEAIGAIPIIVSENEITQTQKRVKVIKEEKTTL